ncbi:MAG: hypothetical protein K2H37_12920, partial [Lachnospiraceae bacterium]|nr:hypothetical protein [Lachnospiraceae bacterium]
AELADAQDLKSCGTNLPYRFDSGRRHCRKNGFIQYLRWVEPFFFLLVREWEGEAGRGFDINVDINRALCAEK